MNRLIYGFGINDADYKIHPLVNGKGNICPFYSKWRSMIQRCYSEKFHIKSPTYINCSVCEEWKYFMTFRAWMMKYDWCGKEIDKDILVPGNKIYCPESCVFVDHATNSVITHKRCNKGKFPTGVNWDKNTHTFNSQACSTSGKKRFFARFKTEKEAENAYLDNKSRTIISIAIRQDEKRVCLALLKIAEDMRGLIHE